MNQQSSSQPPIYQPMQPTVNVPMINVPMVNVPYPFTSLNAPVQPQPVQTTTQVPELRVYLTETRNEFSAHICTCCMDDSATCLQGCFCPCCLFGKNVENFLGKSCCKNCMCYMFCCGPCNHASYRRRLRLKYNLKNDCSGDLCTTCCCPCCSLIQEARELRYQDSKPTRQFMVWKSKKNLFSYSLAK
jgi:Cys-rich protein (TIGR01571 family)